MELIGSRVRKLREEQGISQENMARLCGIERSYYGRIERGKANIGIELLLRIAAALAVGLPELVIDVTEEICRRG
ncbi:helix-turn-helix domain-containing protein [Sphingomonas parva]|uniref:helix-turn-helix domain-containing protein n=1 Tax=Sphingomonas parva TaxID=2555898 RepID=UPI001CDD0B1E|nr:helix-turn-helix transcriptional regulator [Sphingomonas parva]